MSVNLVCVFAALAAAIAALPATREKGRRVVEAMVEGMLKEVAALRAAALPAAR